jgi:hypothetical protein
MCFFIFWLTNVQKIKPLFGVGKQKIDVKEMFNEIPRTQTTKIVN